MKKIRSYCFGITVVFVLASVLSTVGVKERPEFKEIVKNLK